MILVEHEPKWEPADLPVDAEGNTKPGFVCVHELENGNGVCGGNVFDLDMADGSHACIVAEERAPEDGMLAHYSAALDEIYRLRQAAAWEAQTIYFALAFATLPRKARRALELARGRLGASACGSDVYTHLSAEDKDMALRSTGAPTTLTRHQWENRNPATKES